MKFKVTKKLLSILLLICLSLQVLPTVADATNINSNPSSIDSEARELTYEDILAGNATVDEVFGKLDANTVPDALDYDVAVSRQHIARLYDEESNDLNRVVFLNADGSKTAYIYDYPVKYINSDGKIKDISLEIKNSSTVGSFETKDNSIVSTFSKNAYDGIRLEGNGESLVLVPNIPQNDTISSTKAMASTEASMAKKTNNKKVSYKYDEKTTIEYSLTYTGFKEDIVVSEYTGQTEYDFTLYTNGLKLVNDNGSFCLKDENNVVKAILGEIIIFTADEKNNTWGELKAETIKENEEYKLTILVDPAFLSDPKTTYPIRIDPTLEICYNNNGAGAISDVTINSNSGSNGTTNTVFIGLRQTYGISRLLMKFPGLDLDEIVGTADITNATVEIRDVMCEADELTIYCYPFTGNVWDESTVTWANVNPGSFSTRLSSNAISYTNGRAQEELYRYKFDITAAVVGWKAGTYNQNKGIIFKSSNAFENGTTYMHKTFASYNYTAYRPSLSITYSEYGNVVSDGTYYINNTYCGEYLRYTSSGATPKAGLIASLGETIRWEIVGVTGGYVIRSKADPTKYLGVPTDTSSINVSLVTLTNTTIPDRCIWNIRGYGGYTVIKNKYSSKYLYSYGNTINTSDIVENSEKPQVILTRAWRILSTSYYGNTSSSTRREMNSNSSFSNVEIELTNSSQLQFEKYYENETLCDPSIDFNYTFSVPNVITISNGVITPLKRGITVVTAVHKVTNLTKSFEVFVKNSYLKSGDLDSLKSKFNALIDRSYAFAPIYNIETVDSTIEKIVDHDSDITDCCNQYKIPKEFVQTVLFREIWCYSLTDAAADVLVQDYYSWKEGIGDKPSPEKTDSSTGLGQIFASTAIKALNNADDRGIISLNLQYDEEQWQDVWEVWQNLHDSNSYNIYCCALVILDCQYEFQDDVPYNEFFFYNESQIKIILSRYNGTGSEAEEYGDICHDYYEIFEDINS